jgi:glycosidase
LLEYYRRLGAMRSEYSDVFVNGELAYLFADSSGALGYSRTYGGRRISVLLNAGDTAKELTFTELGLSMPTVALSSGGYQSDGSGITVGGWSGVVLTESDEVP